MRKLLTALLCTIACYVLSISCNSNKSPDQSGNLIQIDTTEAAILDVILHDLEETPHLLDSGLLSVELRRKDVIMIDSTERIGVSYDSANLNLLYAPNEERWILGIKLSDTLSIALMNSKQHEIDMSDSVTHVSVFYRSNDTIFATKLMAAWDDKNQHLSRFWELHIKPMK